jgi:serine/threonine protein kinase
MQRQDDRYEIGEEIARGAFGVVRSALDRETGRRVALKTPRRPDLSPGERERFLREARLAARLQHPGIVPVLDAGEIDGLPYFAMPLLDARPLRGPLPPDRAAAVVRDLAAALAWAHARGVVHRDLKPENVLVHEGRPLLADFGAARAADGLRVTGAGELVGTPAYMAPELLLGGARDAGPAADAWSLGVLAFELVAGRLPFEGRDFREFSARVLSGPAPPLPGAPRLAPWVARCLQRDPALRPSAAEIAAGLAAPARPRLLPAFGVAAALLAGLALPRTEPAPPGMVRLAGAWIDAVPVPPRPSGWSFLDAAAACLRRGARVPDAGEWEAAARAGLAGSLPEWTSTPGAGDARRILGGGPAREYPGSRRAAAGFRCAR